MFAETFFFEMFQNLLKGVASGIGRTAIQPAAKFVLNLFASKFKVIAIKNKVNNIYINDKEISKNTCEWAILTIYITFQENGKNTVRNLLKFINTPDKFKEYLINSFMNYSEDFSILGIDKNSTNYSLYENIIIELVNDIYDYNTLDKYLSFLTENQREMLEFEQLSTIIEQLNNYGSKFQMVTLLLQNIMEFLSDNKNICNSFMLSSKINDQNNEYIDKYNLSLFLESEDFFIREYKPANERRARLSKVFVLPEIRYYGSTCNIEDTLCKWAFSTGDDEDLSDAKIFILYGKAGDGKTSLVSHILKNNILGYNCHAIALRDCIDVFSEENGYYKNGCRKSMWQSVKECFRCNDDSKYENKVLILDGLDEICVLQSRFSGKDFLDELSAIKISSVKILITSRDGGYFDKPKPTNYLTYGTIVWNKDKVEGWCNQFSSIHPCRKDWCNKFPNMLKNTEKKFQDAFCTPSILYICCVCKIDISKERSIAGIYDEAFRKIGYREHNPDKTNKDLQKQDIRQHKVNWQYTKELAFQMFLNNKIEAVVAENDMNKFAVKRTKEILEDNYENINPELKNYFAICCFTSKKGNIVEFAHKTMGEYFTAVKLYEDYFKGIFDDNVDENETDERVWKAIFDAFRYGRIPKDIMLYLADIIRKREDEKWFDKFFGSYYRGMMNELIWKQLKKEAIYQTNYVKIVKQIAVSFRNLTWLLTSLEFKNDSKVAESFKYRRTISDFFIRDIIMDVNCSKWKNLYNINMCYANLEQANFSYADLSGSNLSGTNLTSTDFSYVSTSELLPGLLLLVTPYLNWNCCNIELRDLLPNLILL